MRSFSVRCGASYNSNNNADVECSTQSPDSEAIATIYYTVNGGSRQTGQHFIILSRFIGGMAASILRGGEVCYLYL